MDLAALIHEYATYDQWATMRFVERLEREPGDTLDHPAISSFPSIRGTLLHIRDAEAAWLARLTGQAVRWPAEELTTLASVLTHTGRFREHVTTMPLEGILRERGYKDLKGTLYSQPAWQMIMHCINHSSYHRGQVVTQMRELGLEDIPRTDLIHFQRTR